LGEYAEVRLRAAETLQIARRRKWLLSTGLDHLSLGRAYPPGSPESVAHRDQAVDRLRHAGDLTRLPLALLARGTQRDLDEVFKIASRSGMRLHLTDYHLAQARLYIRENRRDLARPHIEKAASLSKTPATTDATPNSPSCSS